MDPIEAQGSVSPNARQVPIPVPPRAELAAPPVFAGVGAFRPTAHTRPPNVPTTPGFADICRAIRYRWFLALLAGITMVTACAGAVRCLAPDKLTAFASRR